MSDLVKVFFVVSNRNHQTGEINYDLGDNYSLVSRGSRRVYGTGHYSREIVVSRLNKCRNGEWFPEQHKARKSREREDTRARKVMHSRYLRALKGLNSK